MKVTILGSTGSIGTQTLDIIRNNRQDFDVYGLVAGSNHELLIKQAKEFNPSLVGIADESKYKAVRDNLPLSVKVISGIEAARLAASEKADMVICAIVGMAGLDSFLEALKSSKRVGLANKEALVCGGELISGNKTELLPIDSEHSAIFQCINGNKKKEIDKIIITASGGPFREKPACEFKDITLKMALKHPNWSMGKKITIDSATLMNKGLEVIEAVRLFNITPENIKVLVHRESIIHSMVEFIDGSVMAQLGNADMRIPIQYAMTYPDRIKNMQVKRLDLSDIGSLHFEKPDLKRFPCLSFAFEGLKKGGLALTALNAANEAAVSLFLQEQIKFTDIPKLVEYGLNSFEDEDLNLENIHNTHNMIMDKIIADYKSLVEL